MKPDITRTPVNAQARKFLSKGTGELDTIQQALEIMGDTVNGETLRPWIERTLANDLEVEMKITIRKCRTGSGYNAFMSTCSKSHAVTVAHFTGLA